jgi:hypothetical protein
MAFAVQARQSFGGKGTGERERAQEADGAEQAEGTEGAEE